MLSFPDASYSVKLVRASGSDVGGISSSICGFRIRSRNLLMISSISSFVKSVLFLPKVSRKHLYIFQRNVWNCQCLEHWNLFYFCFVLYNLYLLFVLNAFHTSKMMFIIFIWSLFVYT